MLPLVLAVALAANPSTPPLKLASPGFKGIRVEADVAEFYSDFFAQHLAAATGVRVTTQSEMGAVLGLERQKQLLGCSDSSQSCLAELAGALGVDGIIIGSLAKLGSGYTISVQIISAKDGQSLVSKTARVPDDDALQAWLEQQAQQLGEALLQKLGGRPPSVVAEPAPAPSGSSESVASAPTQVRTEPSTPGAWTHPSVWAPITAGVVLLGTGLFFTLDAQAQHRKIASSDPSLFDGTGQALKDAAARGARSQTLGALFEIAGVAGLGAGAVIWWRRAHTELTPTIAPAADGAQVSLRGTF